MNWPEKKHFDRKIVSRTEGFSLIEVVIALAVFAIVVVGFTYMMTGGIRGIFSAGYKSSALYEAQQGMENAIAGQSGSGTDSILLHFTSDITVGGTVLTVNQSFNDANGVAQSVSVTSFVADQ